MKDILLLLANLLTTIAKLLGFGGAGVIVADSLLTKQQLLIINRTRRHSLKITELDRLLMGFYSLFSTAPLYPESSGNYPTLDAVEISQLLKQRKYRLFYSVSGYRKPGPKCPSRKLKAAIIGMERPNPNFSCPRIAQQINLAFGITIDNDVVRK